MRDFPCSMNNRFPVTVFVQPGDNVTWSNSLGPEEDKAAKEAGNYVPYESYQGVAVEVYEDHAIVRMTGGDLVRVGDPRKQYWFARPATAIFYDVLGLPEINAGKLRDLIDFGDSDIGLWPYLAALTKGRPHLADEVVNFILGPLAAALKARSSDPTKGGTIYGFRDRDMVVSQYALEVMFEAVALGLVPKSVRKELDAFMVSELGITQVIAAYEEMEPELQTALGHAYDATEIDEANEDKYSPLLTVVTRVQVRRKTREMFYDKLSQLLETVMAAAGVDIGAMVDRVFADNPAQAEKAKSDPRLVGWAMGQVMKASPTKLDPNEVRAVIIEKLG